MACCAIQGERSRQRVGAVIYADWKLAGTPPPRQILDLAIAHSCKHLLIDTYDKTAGNVLDFLPSEELHQLFLRAKDAALLTVLAGSLTIESLPQINQLPIDLIAVRGAVCGGDRLKTLQQEKIRLFQTALSALPWQPTRHFTTTDRSTS